MELPIWAAYILLAVVVAAIVFFVVRAIKASKDQYKDFIPVVGTIVPVRVKNESDHTLFATCFNEAVQCIVLAGVWTLDEIEAKLAGGVLVEVMPTAVWVNSWGQKVGGTVEGGIMKIGPNRDVICHELIHVCEEKIDGKADTEWAPLTGHSGLVHKTWPARGFDKADWAYRTILAKG